MNEPMNAKTSISYRGRTQKGNGMKKTWALLGVLIALTVLATACGDTDSTRYSLDVSVGPSYSGGHVSTDPAPNTEVAPEIWTGG